MSNGLFQWQQAIWQQLVNAVQKKCLPHALLLIGENGIGKKHLAEIFAAALLCPEFQKVGQRCGNCHACHLSDAQTHPDLMRVESESGHAIKVDQIREVILFVNQTALLSGYRVIIIHPATAMNINAANALLKTLEEPTPDTLLILTSDQSVHLPATIISRCQRIFLQKPTTEQGLNWLKDNVKDNSVDLPLLLSMANGAPFAALQMLNEGAYTFRQDFYKGLHQLSEQQADPVELAERWQENNSKMVLNLTLSWMRDLLRFKTTQDDTLLCNQDFRQHLIQTSQKFSETHLLDYLDHVQKINGYVRVGCNLNQRLLFEELLIKWTYYAAC